MPAADILLLMGKLQGGAAAGVFSEKAIHSSVMQYVVDNYSTATVNYDEEPFDFGAASEAVEVDVLVSDSPVRRKGGKEIQSVTITVYCWAKKGTNLYRVEELTDSVVSLLDQATIDIRDYDSSGDPVVGWLKLREAAVTDITRTQEDDLRTDGRLVRVDVEGSAIEK